MNKYLRMERGEAAGAGEMKGLLRVDYKQLRGHKFEDVGEMDKS